MYEEIKAQWTMEMNERVKAAGRDDVLDWELYLPFRYLQCLLEAAAFN